MISTIPTFNIDELNGNVENIKEVFFSDNTSKFLNNYLNKPYRSTYYGLGLCISGQATLMANLEYYEVKENSIVTISPQVIKKWTSFSEDYKVITVFFTKSFLSKYFSNQNYMDQFGFFDQNTKHVNHFSKKEIENIIELLQKIKTITNQVHSFQNEILTSYINILLFDYQSIFGKLNFKSNFQQTRSQQIADDFKKLVSINFKNEHSVKFYAEKLFVTTKYLTETIKLETGKTSSEWIDETLILEAKILLSNPALQITQIAEILHFPDASTFGKFFKNHSKTSPLTYRQSL